METNHEERLYKIFNNVNDWLKFAEAKNFGLLSLNAAIVFGFSQTDFECSSVILKAGYVFGVFALLSFLICLIPLFPILNAIQEGKDIKESKQKEENKQNDSENKKKEEDTEKDKQKKQGKMSRFFKAIGKVSGFIDDETPFESIHFYGYLRTLEIADFEAKFLEKIGSKESFSQFEEELGDQIIYNSRITWLKYRFFKIGAFIFLCGIAAFVIALLLYSIKIPLTQ